MREMKKRVALMAAFAVVACTGVFAGPASAAPLPFDGAAADIGPLLKGQNVLCDDQTRPGATPCPPDKTIIINPNLTNTPNPGDFTVAAGDPGFNFPEWKTKLDTTALNVDVVLTATANGNYNLATGALAMQPAPFTVIVTAVGALPGPSDLVCTSTGNMWAFTTINGPPGQTPDTGELLGQNFAAPATFNQGAVVALWDSINQFPDPIPMTMANECAQLNLASSGPGGLWIGRGLARNFTRKAAPPATTPPATTPPAKKCKKGFKKKGKKCVKKKKKK